MSGGRWSWCVCALAFGLGCAPMGADNPAAVADAASEEEVAGFRARSASEGFWAHWSDGKAELSGYDLIQPRYGELRHGRAVMIYVTEPWSRSAGVKADVYDRGNPDHTVALKLNAVRKFQTGIYDYSVMTSVFSEPRDHFKPMKITFSMQEWCGSVFEEDRFDADGAGLSLRSYFEGETGEHRLEGEELVSEDALWITLRGLASETLERPGGRVELIPSAMDRRFRHVAPSVSSSEIGWTTAPATVEVPAGSFEVYEASWVRQSGVRCQAQVEVPWPHRLIGWSCSDGEQAKLTGSARLAYWGTHSEGDERLLKELGLSLSSYAP